MLGVAGCGDDPVAVAEVPGADDPGCAELLDALPDAVADQPRREVTPTGSGAAWGEPPITLRCGVGRPEGFGSASSCLTVNGVDWFLPPDQLETGQASDVTMTTVHQRPRVEVHLPAEHWPPATTLADLTDAVVAATERVGRCR